MPKTTLQKPLLLLGILLAVWLGTRYLLPVLLPFLLGALVALAAEPLVRFGQRLRLPRVLAAGVGFSVTLGLILACFFLLGAFIFKEMGILIGLLPDVEETTRLGLVRLQDWMIGMADRTPEGVRPLVTRSVLGIFDGGEKLLENAGSRLPGMMTSALGWVSNGALGVGTGVLAGFMISARLPKLKAAFDRRMPTVWKERYLPGLTRMRHALGGWLRAQLKLVAVTYGILAVGFLLLRIPYGIGWAAAVALVDAVPLLGTGTVLIPWALVCLLQGENLRAMGLLGIYGVAFLTRTTLEPRLVGRQLGLDPLLALLALYVGYRFWGLLGMLLAPMAAAAAKSLQTEQS